MQEKYQNIRIEYNWKNNILKINPFNHKYY